MAEDIRTRLIVEGDSSSAENALERVSSAAGDADASVRRAGDGAEDGFGRAGEAADGAEGRAQGFADTLTGTTDIMAGLGEVAKGNTYEGILLLGTGAADLAGGLAAFVIPTLAAVSSGMLGTAVATARSTAAAVANRVTSIAAAAASKAWAAAQWLLNAALTANPIGVIIALLAAAVVAIVLAYRRSETFRAIVQAAMRGAAAAFQALWSKVQAVFGWIGRNWRTILAVLTGPIGLAVAWILSRWGQLSAGITSRVGSIIATVRGIPGRIRGALGDLGSLLLGAGRRVIDGFIRGIRAGFDRVRAELSRLTSLLPDWKGPEDVDATILYRAGQTVIGGFVGGMRSEFPTARAELGGLTGSLATAAAVGVGAAGGPGGDTHYHVHGDVIASDRQLVQRFDKARDRVSRSRSYVAGGGR